MFVQDYSVSNYEYCKNVSPVDGNNIKTMDVIIPKYMTNMKTGKYKKKIIINRNLFINDSDCKINVSKTVTEQGYYTIGTYPNEKLDFSNKMDSNGKIPPGTSFLLETMYEDPTTSKLTGKV